MLAHSLSAQLVHLEAARLLIERGADREQILERVVAARGMARDGLAETRQALSALRGDMTPLEDFLAELVGAADGAESTITGERSPLPAEASQAVRRVAQEALTNVRKHAAGAKVRLWLEYGEHQVTLVVRDSGGLAGRPRRERAPGTVCWVCGSAPSCWAVHWRPGRTRRGSWCR